ncbi:MAG: hypothetical protein CMP23_15110 [Rickettsiales bacterium]|nr:hypothetical protein [Rickettsiales bacterium]
MGPATLPTGGTELVTTCASCAQDLQSLDRFCRNCGTRRGGKGPIVERPAVILALLFLGVGPLALPLLWRSRHFSRSQKATITTLNLALVGGIVVLIVMTFQRYLKMLLELSSG